MDTSRIWLAVLTLVVATVVVWVIGAIVLGLLTEDPEQTVFQQIFVGVMLAAGGIWAHVILSALYRE